MSHYPEIFLHVFSVSIPAEALPTWSSCDDLHKYFESTFAARQVADTPQAAPPPAEASDCIGICFLCASPPNTARSLAQHFRKAHIVPYIREYLNGTATNLELVLLFHYACVRHFSLQPRDENGWDSDLERAHFYQRYRAYSPGKEIDRPDERDFPTIAAHLRKLAVKEYSQYVAFRARRAQKEHQRAALREAKRTCQWRCRCGAIFLSTAELSSHIAAAEEIESIPEASRRLTAHSWVGDRSPLIDDTRTFSELHRKLVHQSRICE